MLENKIGWNFDNTYAKLPSYMVSKINPTSVKSPEIVIINHGLSKDLDLNFSDINEIGRAHVRTPVTSLSRMPSSA